MEKILQRSLHLASRTSHRSLNVYWGIKECSCFRRGNFSYLHSINRLYSANVEAKPLLPSVRRLLEENHLKESQISSRTGPKGHILKGDVLSFLMKSNTIPQQEPKKAPTTPQTTSTSKPTTTPSPAQNFEDIPHNNIRKIIAKRLTEAKSTIPHAYVSREMVIDKLLKARTVLNKGASETQAKISVNDFIIRAAALALRSVPQANVSYDPKTSQVLFNKSVDISVAVATPNGLITPIVKNADRRGLADIAKSVQELASKAQKGKLLPEEFQGGSFSISNLGMYGIDEFIAVINPPQAAILAVGKAKQEVIVTNDKPEIVSLMKVTLSCDQRAMDENIAADFLNAFRTFVENPDLMIGT